MNQSNNKSFLDRGTLIALVIVMGFWLFWSKFMETKYPQQNAGTPQEVVKDNDQTAQPAEAASSQGAVSATAPGAALTAPASESVIDFSDENLSFVLSSKGMGLRKINVKAYTTRDNQPIVLSNVEQSGSFATISLKTGAPVDFAIERVGQNEFIGRGTDGVNQFEKRVRIDSANYRLFVETTVSGETVSGVATEVVDELQPYKGSSFLAPSYDHQDFFVFHEKEERHVIDSSKGLSMSAANVSVLGLNAHYFATGVVDRSEIAPRFESKIAAGSKVAVGRLIYEPASRSNVLTIKYEGFAGPKTLPVLRTIDERLTRLIDYGMFKMIAKPLLWLLRFFHDLVKNWGIAIILLTLLVRLLVMPFNIYSFKSMKVMQRIQPEMKLLREKYKNDPARMNQEVMGLMKRHKANPLGGCLPMLLQLPVFIALFSVLSMSIELYKAPFALWIHDLSVKDQFYVLPVLMGVAMYFQQKMTPTTMDPAQAKVMAFMPIIFAAMMISLPSGLTLYIFVSTVFGIAQQMIFMRDKAAPVAA